ncbi:MAG: mevalonate kinase [Candidatus Daviesbacteria bacterium]|nr:mevalonate kinase [Candidatus Daviesbacteria bacterium]
MKKSITVSAPGKLMLLGEHAVVYGRPCIVTAVNQRMKATVELTDEPVFELNAPDVQVLDYKKPMSELGQGDIPKGAKFVEIAVKNFFSTPEVKKMRLHLGGVAVATASEFSSKFGFGSSSASTVCVVKALFELFKDDLAYKQGLRVDLKKSIFEIALKTVLDIQGKGSGFDVAVAVYGGTLYFVTGGKVIELLHIDSLPLIVGYSGIKADTVTLINQVLEKDQDVVGDIYTNIGKLVEQAKPALLSKDWSSLGKLMNEDQKLLENLGVSIKKLDDMILAAQNAGAYGAKLSGAGGGDCMIALAPDDKTQAVKDGITAAGGQVIEIETNAEGVKAE